jgi:outer membrane protein assembly factor BamB
MGYPEYYRKACEILRCKPEASFEAKRARFHRMVEQWQQECHHCMGGQGQQHKLSDGRLEELKGAMSVIYEFENFQDPRPQPLNWRERFWQDLPVGQLIPEFSLGEDFAPWVVLRFANGIMYTRYKDFSIGAIDMSAKEEIWRFPTSGRITPPVMDQDFLVFGSANKHVYAVDASTGQEFWRSKASAQIRYSPAVSAGSVFVSAGHTQFHCLDLYTGRKKWSVRTDTKVLGRPFCYNNLVFQFAEERRLYCHDVGTGECRWTARTEFLDARHLMQVGGVLVAPQHPWWYRHRSYYECIEKNGSEMSDSAFRDPITGEEVADEARWRPQSFLAFQIMTGSVAWVLPMPGSIGGVFSADGVIYGTCRRDNETAIFAIEGETGRELWTFGLKPEAYGRVLAHDGRIYYLDCDGDMYSVVRP